MRVLFVNHTSSVSGAEQGLMRLVDGLRRDLAVAVACPSEGALAERVDAAAVARLPVPAFEASLRLHPLHTPVGLAWLGAGGVSLARAARRWGADLLHANSPRAGLMCAIARGLGGPPVVVHVRDDLPLSPVSRAVRFTLAHSAAAVVAVSQYTARRFNAGLDRPLATHVYNSIDHARFDPDRVAPAPIRAELGIGPDAALLGQVAQITPWKGQDTAIRVLAELHRRGVAAHLLLIGEVRFAGRTVRYDNRRFDRGLHLLADDLAVGERVHFLGQRRDVPALLRALDLSLLPSWNEPFGRATVESMAMETPPLVSDVGSGPELVTDGVSGRLLPARRPEPWAAAAQALLADRDALAHMGAQARQAASRFTDEAQLQGVRAVYERVLGTPGGDVAEAAVPRGAEEHAEAAPWPG
jgi:L-malate glycosyltransferase